MLVKNLKISEIFVLQNISRTVNGATFESEFIGFAAIKEKNGVTMVDVLQKNKEYKTVEAPMDKVGMEYAPRELHDPLSKYTTKKVITKKGLQKILHQKKIRFF